MNHLSVPRTKPPKANLTKLSLHKSAKRPVHANDPSLATPLDLYFL